MKGESIIYLGKEWGQNPTSCNHVFEHLARDNKVLWVNSIASRNPQLTSAKDWRRILAKLWKMVGGLRQVGPSAWVYQPLFIPLPYSAFAQRINRLLLRRLLRRQARVLHMDRPQLWLFQPNGAFLIGRLDESVVVYYCVDAWSELPSGRSHQLSRLEEELLHKAHICFVTSSPLLAAKQKHNPNTFLARHGVDHQHFATALLNETTIPADIACFDGPVIGFFGLLQDRFDLVLIEKIAAAHPEWNVVLIGGIETDAERLHKFRNIRLLGRRDYSVLPGYCKRFSVGIIPYVMNEWNRNANPIKLREYLSAGLPVVCTDIPEARAFADLVYLASSHEEFISKIELALREDNDVLRRARCDAMLDQTWDVRIREVVSRVVEFKVRLGS